MRTIYHFNLPAMKDKPKFTLRRTPEPYRYEIAYEDGISDHARHTLAARLTALIEDELADELIELGFDPDTIVFEVRAMVRPEGISEKEMDKAMKIIGNLRYNH
jgi:hypothetical protein